MIQNLNPADPILLIDDEEHVLISFDTELREGGFNNIISCSDSRQAESILSSRKVSAVLLDLWMPHLSGEELLPRIAAEYPETPVIIITGLDQVETVVNCMKSGAFDYLVKPVESGLLTAVVGRALRFRELNQEIESLKDGFFSEEVGCPEAFSRIVTRNEAMFSAFRYVEAVAGSSQPVLITGETGVGKELFAKAIHSLSGREGDFVPVNAAGLDDAMFDDTLFGHKKGAFTGARQARPGLVERAAGGTLFLDEIGDLTPAAQLKLLRMIQEKEYLPLGEDQYRLTNARVIVAANRDLQSAITAGTFRKDLYYRLRTHQVHIPTLMCRKDDIPLLVDHFLAKAADEMDKKKPTPPRELYTLLKAYHFPGNVRELRAMVYDAVSSHQTRVLSLDVFKNHINAAGGESPWAPESSMDEISDPFGSLAALPTLNQASEMLIREAIHRTDGNISQAAQMLGVTRQALSKRLSRIGE